MALIGQEDPWKLKSDFFDFIMIQPHRLPVWRVASKMRIVCSFGLNSNAGPLVILPTMRDFLLGHFAYDFMSALRRDQPRARCL